ncbi:MAG: MarR family winged helix-turn-helix transcriptional regulator [Actinomycetota bacterium]
MNELPPCELRAWRAFLQSHARVVRRLDAELQAERGLTLSAYEVLLRLRSAPDRRLRMSDLAEDVLLSPSGATRVVDQLVRRGLVERCRGSVDGRSHLAILTKEGLQELRAAAPIHIRGIQEHFTGKLSERELDQLATALEPVGTGNPAEA